MLVEKRAADPFAEQALAEAGVGFVERPEQRALLGVVGGVAVHFERLERGAVDEHVLPRAEGLEVLGQVEDVL